MQNTNTKTHSAIQYLVLSVEIVVGFFSGIKVKNDDFLLLLVVCIGLAVIISTFFWFYIQNLKTEMIEFNNKRFFELKQKMILGKGLSDNLFDIVLQEHADKNQRIKALRHEYIENVNKAFAIHFPNNHATLVLKDNQSENEIEMTNKYFGLLNDEINKKHEDFSKWKYLANEPD